MSTPSDGRQRYVFLSYASVDSERVLPVVSALEKAGVAVWTDREGIDAVAPYLDLIGDAIHGKPQKVR